jgi:hypothetical protein
MKYARGMHWMYALNLHSRSQACGRTHVYVGGVQLCSDGGQPMWPCLVLRRRANNFFVTWNSRRGQ